jgi:oxygen-independent coproporphyrinogen-3 oxidase
LINESQYPINKGCFLSEPSEVFKRYILDTACKGKVTFKKEHYDLLLPYTIPRLRILAEDGLITLKKEGFKVNEQGRQYLRNICQAFDLEWWQSEARLEEQIFSRSV